MSTPELYEQAFIKLIAERVEDIGMSHSEFGKLVFGKAGGVRIWRSCRDIEGRGRSLTLAEAYRIAEVLGSDFPCLVWNLTMAAKNRGMLAETAQDKDEQ